MKPRSLASFDVHEFLDAPGVGNTAWEFRRNETIYTQGDAGDTVMYIQSGGVKLSVRSPAGREVVVAILGPGDFFGEGCMAGQPRRRGSASAVTLSNVVILKKREMLRLLHQQPGLADRFITHVLGTSIRIEEELVDQLRDQDEKRLARTLLLLASYGKRREPGRALTKISGARLARLSGTTQERVDFFMKKFKRLGFIGVGRQLKIHNSLLNVVLHE